MATFTARLSDVLEILHGTSEDPLDYEIQRGTFTFNGVKYDDLPILVDNGSAIGLSQYPIFDEDYRPILNGKIVDEYFNREIGAETIDDFKLTLRRKMQQVMPYYNKLYEAEAVQYSALQTMDIHSVSESQIDSEESGSAVNNSESETESEARVVNSTTPQTMLQGNADYAHDATDTSGSNTVAGNSQQTSNNASNTASNSDNRVTGFQGSASDLMVKYRNSLINVDIMVLNEITDCFMLLLNNGDSYSKNSTIWYGW